jgi:hypothetical protein
MPLNLGSANRCRELTSVESEGLLVISPRDLRPSNHAGETVREILRQRSDVAAVIVLQETSVLSMLFAEAWAALPSRLASLAICPPAATFVVVRSRDSDRLMRHAHGTSDALWRCLVELGKEGSRIEVRTEPSSDGLVLANQEIQVDSPEETWLPELLSAPPRRELEWLYGELRLARLSDLCGEVVSPSDAAAVLAGLWLLHGDADASHRQSQSIEDEGRHRCGNFWHAIMHRQEPDSGNSKYWFRRVGQPDFLADLAKRAEELIVADGSDGARRWRTKLGLPGRWDSLAFVDWCEAAARDADASQTNLVRHLQFIEMHLLLRASYADATRPT